MESPNLHLLILTRWAGQILYQLALHTVENIIGCQACRTSLRQPAQLKETADPSADLPATENNASYLYPGLICPSRALAHKGAEKQRCKQASPLLFPLLPDLHNFHSTRFVFSNTYQVQEKTKLSLQYSSLTTRWQRPKVFSTSHKSWHWRALRYLFLPSKTWPKPNSSTV